MMFGTVCEHLVTMSTGNLTSGLTCLVDMFDQYTRYSPLLLIAYVVFKGRLLREPLIKSRF